MIELLKNRRSTRKYNEKKVEQEKIDKILDAALLSPSSRNRKPWEFIVVQDKKLLKELSNSRERGANFLEESPLAVVIISDVKKCDVWIEDCTITGIIMQIECEKLGLSSCWIQVRERMYNESVTTSNFIKKTLDIPDRYEVLSIISIGYKEDKVQNKKEVLEKAQRVHNNKYCNNNT